MALYEISPAQGSSAKLARPVELVCFALVIANAVYLAASYFEGFWLVAPDGAAIQSDFVNVWAAGRLALAGHAAAAYDWPTHKLMEETAVGHAFEGYFGWHYPPTFLFVAAILSLLPYAPAYALWAFGTFPGYLVAVRAIIGDRVGYLLAAAFPAVLPNFIVGQNGFLTAGLVGGALVLLERRPIVAGMLLGLLTYKPHLGLLFPIALMAGGYWRTFFTAALVAVLMAAASWLAFGGEAWQAFFANIGHTSQAFLSEGWADWSKLQTAFGLTRTLGGSETLAWTIQAAVSLAAAAAVAILWRSNAAYEIKAAALGVGVLLATPYLYMYDLVVLAVPMAFLLRLGNARGFLPKEMAWIGIASGLMLAFPFVKAPVGFAALLLVVALLARRLFVPASVTT
ncbi:MAG: glycosyltransferase family 87 protein [Xanthobacteraceae bacterium]